MACTYSQRCTQHPGMVRSFEPLQLAFDSTKFSDLYNGSSYVAAYLACNWTSATTIEKGGSAGFNSLYILGYILQPLDR
jgi:hypothetical protein